MSREIHKCSISNKTQNNDSPDMTFIVQARWNKKWNLNCVHTKGKRQCQNKRKHWCFESVQKTFDFWH